MQMKVLWCSFSLFWITISILPAKAIDKIDDKPDLHVLSIGIKYDSLEYITKDAADFASAYWALKDDKVKIFRKINIYQLTTKETTNTYNLKVAFESLNEMKIKENDLLIVFISAIGKLNEENEFLILPSDYNPKHEDIVSVKLKEDILERLQNLSNRSLLLIDACRNLNNGMQSRFMNDIIHSTQGIEIISACGDGEYSYEDKSWENGAFAQSIIEAFSNQLMEVAGKKIRSDLFAEHFGSKRSGGDGIITLEELKLFIQQRIPYMVKTTLKTSLVEQNPTNRATDRVSDNLAIYKVQ